jgi:hypothetical protein
MGVGSEEVRSGNRVILFLWIFAANHTRQCWIDLNPGPVKLRLSLPLSICYRLDQGCPLIHG